MTGGAGASRARVVAELVEGLEAETPYGGRSTTWQELGTVWLETEAVRRRSVTLEGLGHSVQRMKARTGEDARLEVGRVLRFAGGDWRIEAMDPERTGRLLLDLERRP